MAGRRTNLSLLWATTLALASGVAAFLVGTPPGRWVVVGHGVISLVIVVLVPWKSLIATRGFARRGHGKWTSTVLSLSVVAALLTGIALISGMVDRVGPFTTMQLHVGFGLLAVCLTLLHTLQRPVPHRRTDFDRRNAIRAGGVLVAAGGLWAVGEAVLEVTSARGADRRFTGSHEILEADQIPATQWLNDRIQHLADGHQVVIGGAGVSAATITAVGDRVEATLDCTGGWYTNQVWSGARLDRFVDPGTGESIVVRSVTGYWRRFPAHQAGELLLATHVAGEPLRDGNGGPVRLVAPGRRGYWWVKWIDRIDIDDLPPWWQPPLPTA